MVVDILKKSTVLKKVGECLENNIRLSLSNLENGEKALVVHYISKSSIVVCKDFVTMSELKHSLTELGHKVATLTYGYSMPVFSYKQEDSTMQEFLSTIYDFYLNKIDVLLVLSETLLQRLPNKTLFEKVVTFNQSQNYKFEQLANNLTSLGYKRCDYVCKKGEFSIRGDIVDIYPINFSDPLRLDFFGDELEKISEFNIDTMKSFNQLSSAQIYPATFMFLNDNSVLQEFNKQVNNIKINNQNYSRLNEIKSTYAVKLENSFVDISDSFIFPFFGFKENILSLFKDRLIYFDEPKKIFDDYNSVRSNNLDSINLLIQKGELLEIHKSFNTELNDLLSLDLYCVFDNFNNKYLTSDEQIVFRTIGSRKYVFDYKALIKDIEIYAHSNYSTILYCGDKNTVDSLGAYLIQNKLTYQTKYNPNTNKPQLVLLDEQLNLSASFLDAGVILIGTYDLVKKSRVDKTSKKSSKRNVFYLPKVGDFVVHSVHGIGKCVKIEKLNLSGIEKDYFVLEYKNGDTLYVPSEQANTISAFLGSEKNPSLNKIGGQEFSKIKERVKRAVKELAINLVELYKQREKMKGYVYEQGNYLMDEFENAFEYDLTVDQQNAVDDIKKDLYSTKVMDRLICGDVGYGKTEVALRAAYQAVLEGKQVAILCPTTILSEQHYKTTKSRTQDFVCNVQVLNRFRTKQQQAEILKQLKQGNIDIIIGTHRLLSDDVVYKNLGMLILDEEHRFGVGDKEKIKTLKKDVDVLTLSATPIPRTLNMAMTGIRDISIIETPPKNRLPVQTYVTEENETLIIDACKRERSRGGQTLIVFNRVERIYEFADNIKTLLPEARIGVAHGQMPERILENTIMQLYNGEFDVLVATTLIENGIDLPLANTLIVIDADRLGLSQLYQLKGRIGRSDRLAYAYFTYNPAKILTQDAYKRLDAILEFTELGSGFKIAMRDLEIRGAGNILGKEQHGHMEKVGYELYCKLLDDAVNELKGQKGKETLPIKVDISCPAFLPEDYVKGEQERIKQYSQISEICSLEQMQEFIDLEKESFGELPKPLVNLLKIALIKNLAVNLDIKRLLCDGTTTKLYLYKKEEIVSQKCAQVLNKYKDMCVLKFEDVPIIELDLHNFTIDKKLEFLINFLLECINN